MTFRKALVALMPALFALASADAAWAGTDCFTLDGQGKVTLDNSTATGTFTATPIYVAGSTALEPLLKAIGPGVTGGASPYVIIYEKTLGSCGGVGLVTGSMPIPHGNPMFYVPLGADGTTNKTCTYPTTAPTPADPPFTVVLSDVDSKLCPGSPALPTGFKDFHGPVNDMVFVVPPMSQQKAISAEQAYLMLGLGADGMATPSDRSGGHLHPLEHLGHARHDQRPHRRGRA